MSRATPSTWTLDDSGWTLHASRTADGRETYSLEAPWGMRIRGIGSPEAARRIARRLAHGFDGNPAPADAARGPFATHRTGDDAA